MPRWRILPAAALLAWAPSVRAALRAGPAGRPSPVRSVPAAETFWHGNVIPAMAFRLEGAVGALAAPPAFPAAPGAATSLPAGRLAPLVDYARSALIPAEPGSVEGLAREAVLAGLDPESGFGEGLASVLSRAGGLPGASLAAERLRELSGAVRSAEEPERVRALGILRSIRRAFLAAGEDAAAGDLRVRKVLGQFFDGLSWPGAGDPAPEGDGPAQASAVRALAPKARPRLLAHGAQGDVFRGRWRSESGELVSAVAKVFARGDPRAVHEFAAMKLLALSEHPGRRYAAEALELLEEDGSHRSRLTVSSSRGLLEGNAVLVVRYESHGSLKALMERNKAYRRGEGRAPGLLLTPRAVARLTREAALGLGALHSVGLVHRDVKPANILLHDDWSARLGDFGLVEAEGVEASYSGTPLYAARDALASLGERVATRPSDDVLALALTMEEALLAGALGLGVEDVPVPLREDIPVPALRQTVPRLTAPVWRVYEALEGNLPEDRRLSARQRAVLKTLSEALWRAQREPGGADAFLGLLP